MGNCLDKRNRNREVIVYPRLRANSRNSTEKTANYSCGTSLHPHSRDTKIENGVSKQKRFNNLKSESDGSNSDGPEEVVVNRSERSPPISGMELMKLNEPIVQKCTTAGNRSDQLGFMYGASIYSSAMPIYYHQPMPIPLAAPIYYAPTYRPPIFRCC